ncbi:MAG: hypothetical protein JO186_08030 [Actinobacteria bacterium]|nr:hypothetical protein [Actinomycetota bacterium]MBV8395401.1 hypothetical protein [Actinomycetota bacterium]
MPVRTIILVAAVALASLAAAAGASAVTIASSRLTVLASPPVPVTVSRKDTRRSCQVAASKARVRLPGPSSAAETERRASTVACEQPPRSNLGLSGALKGAEAGAIAVAG